MAGLAGKEGHYRGGRRGGGGCGGVAGRGGVRAVLVRDCTAQCSHVDSEEWGGKGVGGGGL